MSHNYTSSDFADLVYIAECLANAEFNFREGTIKINTLNLDYELCEYDVQFCKRVLIRFNVLPYDTTCKGILKSVQKCIDAFYK